MIHETADHSPEAHNRRISLYVANDTELRQYKDEQHDDGYFTPEKVAEIILCNSRFFWLDIHGKDGKICGFLVMERKNGKREGELYIDELYIAPEMRRRGIAERVVRGILMCQEKPVSTTILDRNKPEREFWDKIISGPEWQQKVVTDIKPWLPGKEYMFRKAERNKKE